VREIPREVSNATEILGDAIEQFDRQVSKAARRKAMRRRIGPRPTRVPASRHYRPVRHRLSLPARYRRPPVRSLLERRRGIEDGQRGVPNKIASAVRRAAGRAAETVRNGLARLRRGLGRLRPGRRLGR
jgi:hypothetical protein